MPRADEKQDLSGYQTILTNPMLYGDTRFKVGTFTKDISDAVTSQAITGIGFQPKAIVMWGGVSGSAAYTTIFGAFDGTTHRTMLYNGSAYDPDLAYILFLVSGANNRSASVASFDADGFTLTWAKTNSPTGTATINYMAFK